MISNKPYYICGFTVLEVAFVFTLIALFFFSSSQHESGRDSVSMGGLPSASTLQALSQIHDEIDALPIDPEVLQQMLLYIEVAESHISAGNIGDAREAVLDFCRRIEWYRYQIGHSKIDRMFNTAMSIAVDLHIAATD